VWGANRQASRWDIRIGQALAAAGQGAGDLLLVEAGQPEVEVKVANLAELEREQGLVPLGFLVGAVVREPVSLDLGGRQPLGHVHGHGGKPDPQGGHEASVAGDDHPLAVDHDGLAEAELLDGGGNLGHRGRVPAWVAGVGDDLIDGDLLDLHARPGLLLSSAQVFILYPMMMIHAGALRWTTLDAILSAASG
jgi:hypothetical protein